MIKKFFGIAGVALLIIGVILFYPAFSYFGRPFPPVVNVTAMTVDIVALRSGSADAARGEVTISIVNRNRMQNERFIELSGVLFYAELYPPLAAVKFTENVKVVARGNATVTLVISAFVTMPPSSLEFEELGRDMLNGTTSFSLNLNFRLVYECKIWWSIYLSYFPHCNYLPMYFASSNYSAGSLKEVAPYSCNVYGRYPE